MKADACPWWSPAYAVCCTGSQAHGSNESSPCTPCWGSSFFPWETKCHEMRSEATSYMLIIIIIIKQALPWLRQAARPCWHRYYALPVGSPGQQVLCWRASSSDSLVSWEESVAKTHSLVLLFHSVLLVKAMCTPKLAGSRLHNSWEQSRTEWITLTLSRFCSTYSLRELSALV